MKQRYDQATLAKEKRLWSLPDDEPDDADDDSLADGVDWRFTQPEDTEGGDPA